MQKTLTLIVAATVFIIMAMALIFNTTDTLSGFGEVADPDSQICGILETDYMNAVEDEEMEEASEIEEEAIERGCSWAN